MKLFIAVVALLVAGPAFADPDMTVANDRGTYVDIASVNGSSTAGTAFLSGNAKRMDGVLFNNTAAAVWIGTTTASLFGVEHSNITNGFPVLASATFRLDGKMTGALYVTCGVAVSACNVRVLEGKNR